MKSNKDDLLKRGFLSKGKELDHLNEPFKKKIKLLKSKVAVERTLGARLLKQTKKEETVEYLLDALKVEQKLYPKIEICNILVEFGELSIDGLIKLMGEIGKNQHKKIPEKEFKKDSYPLPRDIASRTIIRIGEKAIPKLLDNLETTNRNQLSEMIDAIGHIGFNYEVKHIYQPLKMCYDQHENDELLKWKILRAMSGIIASKSFLQKEYSILKNEWLKKEINRSLRLIEKRKNIINHH